MLYIGAILFAIGGCCADSDNLIIPTVLTFTGAIILLIESRKENDNE